MGVILCVLLFMKGCTSCKYTPAASKKELSKQLYFVASSSVSFSKREGAALQHRAKL